ncbi:MAG: hypothetical protein ACE14M_07180 [Terriglobales bacterium]
MALLLMTVMALVLIWGVGSFDIGRLDSYRIMLIILLSVAALLQATFRIRAK